MKICIVIICLCFYVGGEKSCKSKDQHPTPDDNRANAERGFSKPKTQEPKYKVLEVACTEDDNCIVFVFCDPSFFNQEDMEKIAEKLSIEFKKKKVVNVNLFDDRETAQAYAKRIPNPRELQYERRGWYLRTDDREFLLFFPDPLRRGEQISVKPRKSAQ